MAGGSALDTQVLRRSRGTVSRGLPPSLRHHQSFPYSLGSVSPAAAARSARRSSICADGGCLCTTRVRNDGPHLLGSPFFPIPAGARAPSLVGGRTRWDARTTWRVGGRGRGRGCSGEPAGACQRPTAGSGSEEEGVLFQLSRRSAETVGEVSPSGSGLSSYAFVAQCLSCPPSHSSTHTAQLGCRDPRP